MTKLVTDTGLQKVLELVADKMNNPLPISIEYSNNTAQVDVDTAGTKHDMIESPESTIELNGRTLVNLWGSKEEDFNLNYGATFSDGFITASGSGNWVNCCSCRAEMFKPNTIYTIVANIIENTLNGRFRVNTAYLEEEPFGQTLEISSGEKGIKIYTLTSKADISTIRFGLRSQMHSEATAGSIKFQCIILEGDYTDVPVEYFEGLKSAGETEGIEVKSTGKNLFDEMWEFGDIEINGTEVNSQSVLRTVNYIAIQPFITYMVSRTNGAKFNKYRFYDKDYNCLGGTLEVPIEGDRLSNNTTNRTFKVLDNRIKYMRIVDTTADVANVYQIEKGTEVTEYEPYKENIITLPEIEPLRSLPNSVCDEAFIHDDKLVITRNLGEITLNGSESWRKTDGGLQDGTTSYFATETYDGLFLGGQDNSICDKFSYKNTWAVDVEGFSVTELTTNIRVRISNSRLSSNADAASFIEWLNVNNMKIVGKLQVPTYEWYELPSPHLYKDGNIFVETGAIPLTSNSHDINVSLRSAINTNVEEIVEIKEELNTLDAEIATGEELLDLWQGIYEGVNE